MRAKNKGADMKAHVRTGFWVVVPCMLLVVGCGPPKDADDVGSEAATAVADLTPSGAGTEEGPSEPGSAEDPPMRFVPTMRGVADVGYLKPATKVAGNMVETTFKVKNLSPRAIAGLKVEEFWRDKAGNLVGGTSDQLREPLLPGETATLVVQTPKDPRMFQNQYRFLHAYGSVKVELLGELD